jgi:hypothetical protein
MTAGSKGTRGLLSRANQVEREAYPLDAASLSWERRANSTEPEAELIASDRNRSDRSGANHAARSGLTIESDVVDQQRETAPSKRCLGSRLKSHSSDLI